MNAATVEGTLRLDPEFYTEETGDLDRTLPASDFERDDVAARVTAWLRRSLEAGAAGKD